MSEILRVARKEMGAFFASPVAYLFLGAFLAITLFVFFWVETFFARNIADVRPLFQWLPLLLIFLVSALTMRLWSEERRAGTLEMLLTLPVQPWRLVAGKFLACMGLVGAALLLTLPLPITVALLGPLDFGPVLGGYLATLFLAGSYVAIGLYVSSRTDNAIVSLIGTALLCGLFYLLGSPTLTGLFGQSAGELLKLLGSGSRFDSITRGVIDLRDLYYYLSIMGVFLALNVYTLERLRWARDAGDTSHHRAWRLAAGLLAANFVAGNLWLSQVGWARTDLTAGRIYSISDATRSYLAQLSEPLTLRGYFSAQTHPLLAPLVPQLRDLLKEYEVAGKGKVRVEIVDPLEHPELEREAGEKFGIKPVAFQTASKYQAAVVNSYFDVVVQYGDQFEKLGFRDLIEVKQRSEMDLDVRLRNPEYDLTRAVKKVLYGYRGGGNLFAGMAKPVLLKGFISAPEKLPEPLKTLEKDLQTLIGEMKAKAGDKLLVELHDPQKEAALAQQIQDRYGFKPMVVGLLDPNPFYFYLVLERGDQIVPVPLPEGLDKASLGRAIDGALKRFAPGFLRTIALYTPPSPQGFMAQMGGGMQYNLLAEALGENAVLERTDLKSGRVPEQADMLMLVGPENLDEKQLFAVDQFLMRGGTVMVAASPFDVSVSRSGLTARKRPTGLEAWLKGHGLTLGEAMVLDPKSSSLPIPVQRRVGGFVVQEVRALPYPYIADIRRDGMEPDHAMLAGIDQLNFNWAAPIEAGEQSGRKLTRLIVSSEGAWSSNAVNLQPNFGPNGESGFVPGNDKGRKLLAAVVEGRFDSHFKGKDSPLLKEDPKPATPEGEPEPPAAGPKVGSVIDHSPEGAKLIVFGSSTFLSDTAMDLASSAAQTRYLNPVQLAQNVVDWSLEDRTLLSIRGRNHFSRVLEPMERDAQLFWEYLNYGLAAAGLLVVWGLNRQLRRRREEQFRQALALGV